MAIAIVLAGGKGSRMKSDMAKQYMRLCGREVLYYPLSVFQRHEAVTDIVLVVREGDTEYVRRDIVDRYGFNKVNDICTGGKMRYNSVYCGLESAGRIISKKNLPDDTVVLIHDGARPFVDERMISESVETAAQFGACTVGVPVKDTICMVDENNMETEVPDRRTLYQVQTPQSFKYSLIHEAYIAMKKNENLNITDDTMLVKQYKGVCSKVIMGSYENIKITTPEDMEIGVKFAEKFC